MDLTIREENGHSTVQNWTAFGHPSDVRLDGLTDAEGGSWAYTYNAVGRLTSVSPPTGPGRAWVYPNNSDLLERETHPESGQISYTYDAAGRLQKRTTPWGDFLMSYDNNERLTGVDAPGTSYDQTFAYDGADNRTLAENFAVRSEFDYDAVNRLEWRKDKIKGQPAEQPIRQTWYSYDSWDNLTQLDYPSGNIIKYEYDTAGRPTVVRRMPNDTLVAEVEYHPAGAIKRLEFANGVVEDFVFGTDRYWVTGIAAAKPNAPAVLDVDYAHDAVGNVTSITDPRQGYSQTFGYDRLHRLTTITGFGANTFIYDPMGNRTTKGSLTYSYDGGMRLQSVTGPTPNPEVGSYAHDNSGNLTVDQSGTYTYTPFNMMETATVGGLTTTYQYDADYLRKIKSNANRWEYFIHGPGGQLLSEYRQSPGAQSATWRRDYIYLGARLLSSLSAVVPTVAFVGPANVSEGVQSGTVEVQIQLTTPTPLSVAASVHVSSVGGTATAGSDYPAVSQSLTLPAGSTTGTYPVTISITQDSFIEANETIELSLHSPTGEVEVGSSVTTVTIEDDESMADGPSAAIDLVWRNTGSHHYAAWDMNGTSVAARAWIYNSNQAIFAVPPPWQLGAVTDINGDGQRDLVWQRTDTTQLQGWQMQQNVYQAAIALPALSPPPSEAEKWLVRAAADMNQDGHKDFIFQRNDGYLAVWLMNGANLVSGQLLYPTAIDPAWQIVGAGDMDKDGKADLVWQRPADGWVSIWKMNGTSYVGPLYLDASLQPAAPPPTPTTWRIHAVTPLDAVGAQDMVWVDTVTRTASVWLLDWNATTERVVRTSGGFSPAEWSLIQDAAWILVGAR